MKARFTAWPIVFVLALAMASSTSRAQPSSSALINEALDKIVELDLDTTLPQAIKSIEEKTGVPLRVSRGAYDMLPWGEQTKLTAKISQQTLRNALAAIAQKLGLRFTVGDQEVLIEPLPALARLGRRSTVDELAIIDALASTPFADAAKPATVGDLLAAVARQVDDAKLGFAIENRAPDADASVKTFRGQSLLDALEEVHKQSRATWYPWGKSIVVLPREDHVRQLLDRPITMRFAGVDVAQVLTELSRRSGVEFTIEPGAVQRIPVESRTIKLILENVSARQALESISGFTGLGYVANDAGVYIWNPAAAPARRADRVTTIMTVDGVQVLLPESELPPDVQQYLKAKRDRAIETLRDQMKKEGFTPTTQPGRDL
jgi:hypothetical protein